MKVSEKNIYGECDGKLNGGASLNKLLEKFKTIEDIN